MKVRRKPEFYSYYWLAVVKSFNLPVDSILTATKPDNLRGCLQITEFPGMLLDEDRFEVVLPETENPPTYKIFKYTLPIQERTHVDLPKGAQVIRVDGLDGGLWIWALCNTTAPIERREFALFKTGGDMPADIMTAYKYIGCGAIYIQQELCLYVFEKLSHD